MTPCATAAWSRRMTPGTSRPAPRPKPGRMVNIYFRSGQVLGVPCEALEETSDVFTRADNLRQLLQVTDYTLSDTAAYYYNGAPADATLLQTITGSYTVTVVDYTGDLTIDAVLIYSE